MIRNLLRTAAAVAILGIGVPALAVTPTPVSFWDFNNSNGQTLGNFDGVANASGGTTPIDLNIKQYNSAGGSVESFFTGVLDNGASFPAGSGRPIEHYVPSGATFAGAGSAYHMEGGTRRQYDDPANPGNADTNAIDPQTQPILNQSNQFNAYRDVLEPEPNENANGAFDATSSITYSFWAAVNMAGQFDPQSANRVGSGTSMLLGRRSDPGIDGGGADFGGQVGVAYNATVNGVDNFRFSLRNGAIVNSSNVLANRGEWHHYVVQYDMAGNSATIWQDGGAAVDVFAGMGSGAILGDLRLNNVAFNGANQRESGDFIIDDLAIWTNTLLTANDAQRLYSLGVAGAIVPEPSTIALAGLGVAIVIGARRRRAKR